jgi:hypothetical protein
VRFTTGGRLLPRRWETALVSDEDAKQVVAAHEALAATVGDLIDDDTDPRNVLCAAVALIRNIALEIGGADLLAEAVELLRGTN